MTIVTIPYSPRQWQKEAHNNMMRWNIFVLHRRAGKTVYGLNELQGRKDGKGCLNINNGRFAYIAPTYKQAKAVAWDLIKNYSNIIPGIEYNETELTVIYPNGAKLRLYGADNPDSLRGISLDGVVFDEYSQQPSNIFSEIIRPALADRKGRAVWIGTPKGKNSFYDLYKYALEKEDWQCVLLRASDTKIIAPDELEDARRLMTSDEYAQEFECSFDASIKGAIYAEELNKCREDGRIVKGLYDPLLEVYTFWDLGVSDSTPIIWVQFSGGQARIIDEYESSGKGLDHYINIVRQKDYSYAKHYFPHDIKNRELQQVTTRLSTVQEGLGHDKCSVVPRAREHDGINACRLMFCNLWFDEDQTADLRNALASYKYEWDDSKGMFKNDPYHDWSSHYADALRYMGLIYRFLTAPTQKQSTIEMSSDLFY